MDRGHSRRRSGQAGGRRGDRPTPYRGGRTQEARSALEASRTADPDSRRGRAKPRPPAPQPESWCAAEIAVLDAEGGAAAADQARRALFERTLSEEPLRVLLAKLADFEDVVALDRAFEIAATYADPMKGLAFLMNWPALREAATMILARRAELRGSWNDIPLWAGRLSGRHPDAALVLVRARAVALMRLGAGVTDEIQGLIAEAEALAESVSDLSLPSHQVFLAELSPAPTRRPIWR